MGSLVCWIHVLVCFLFCVSCAGSPEWQWCKLTYSEPPVEKCANNMVSLRLLDLYFFNRAPRLSAKSLCQPLPPPRRIFVASVVPQVRDQGGLKLPNARPPPQAWFPN